MTGLCLNVFRNWLRRWTAVVWTCFSGFLAGLNRLPDSFTWRFGEGGTFSVNSFFCSRRFILFFKSWWNSVSKFFSKFLSYDERQEKHGNELLQIREQCEQESVACLSEYVSLHELLPPIIHCRRSNEQLPT